MKIIIENVFEYLRIPFHVPHCLIIGFFANRMGKWVAKNSRIISMYRGEFVISGGEVLGMKD